MLRVSRFVAVGVLAAVVAAAPVRVWAQESPATPPAADTPPAPAPAQTPATPAPAGVATLKPEAPDTNASIIERVLVRVNGEVFTQSQLTQLQIERLRDMERPKDFNLQATLAKITPDLLVQAVDELLLVQRGRELGVTFTDKQFQDALDNVKKANNLDDAGLQKALKEEGETMETLRQRFERSYLEQAVQQREIGPSMTITQEEQRQYYQSHKDKFMTPTMVTLRELTLNVPTTTQGEKTVFSVGVDNAVKARIEALRKRALAGEDFVTLVSEASESGTKTAGGLVGPVNVDDLNPTLANALADLKPGQVTEPIRGPKGYQLFELEKRNTPELKPFEDVRTDIEQAIRLERLGPETQKLLERLRTQAVIEWKDENFRKMYEKRAAELAVQNTQAAQTTPAAQTAATK